MNVSDLLNKVFDSIENNELKINVGILNNEINASSEGIGVNVKRPKKKERLKIAEINEEVENLNLEEVKDRQPIDFVEEFIEGED